MSLTPSQVDAIARRVVEVLEDRGGQPWGDVKTVARELGVQEEWVYENARRLGGVKLGPGRAARWRFEMTRLRRLVASGALEQEGDPPADAAPTAPADDVRRPANGTPHRRPDAPAPVTRPRDSGFDDAPRPMAKLDLSGRFTALNPAFAKLVGYAEDEFTRARWPSPHDRDEFAAQTRALRDLASGRIGEVSFLSSFLHAQGLVVRIAGRLALVRDGRGDPAHLLLVAEGHAGA